MVENSVGALDGLKVIDLTRVLGGPYATQILADYGASVIKLEPPQGDEVRDWGPPFFQGDASYFLGLNRNKRSLALDLTKEGGREVFLRLLADADILIENIVPIGNEMRKLMNDQSYLIEILKQGSSKAYDRARNTMNEVYDIVGLFRNET